MSPDLVNGLFCIVGAMFMSNNLRVLWKDKMSRGLSLLSQTFFCSWNIWSLAFYFQIAQWWSFAGQAVVVALYIAYIVLLFYYRRKESKWRDTGWRPSWEDHSKRGPNLRQRFSFAGGFQPMPYSPNPVKAPPKHP